MKLDMTFEESNQRIDVTFAEVQTASDGGFEKGYEQGYTEGSENGYKDGLMEGQEQSASKFGILNEVTGTNIVTCDYVNENEHSVEVKLSSDTVTDFSGVMVKCLCKNFWNKDYASNEDNWVKRNNSVYPSIPVFVGKGSTVTISYSDIETGISNIYFAISKDGTNTNLYSWMYHATSTGLYKNVYTLVAENDYIYPCYSGSFDNVIQYISNELQIELSPYKTDYKPYTEKTYTANADGTVDGITSISPTMNIICEGVDISAKYYCCPSVEYDRFWDIFQEYGERTNYNYAFYNNSNGSCWTEENIRPKYPIIPTEAQYLFAYSKIEDMELFLKEHNIVLDFAKTTGILPLNYLLMSSKITNFPTIDVSGHTKLTNIFRLATKLRVAKLKGVKSNQIFDAVYQNCSLLEEVYIDGVVGTSISLQWSSKLTIESAKNLIRCLANLIDTNPFAMTITFHGNVWSLLDAEGNASPNGNTWKEYIVDKGWNWN